MLFFYVNDTDVSVSAPIACWTTPIDGHVHARRVHAIPSRAGYTVKRSRGVEVKCESRVVVNRSRTRTVKEQHEFRCGARRGNNNIQELLSEFRN